MIFNKRAHFSIYIIKPICANEIEVINAPQNAMNYIEDICKELKLVACIAAGVYGAGGCAPVKALLYLQEKCGLALFFELEWGNARLVQPLFVGDTLYTESIIMNLKENVDDYLKNLCCFS